jgi:hypothetical protein
MRRVSAALAGALVAVVLLITALLHPIQAAAAGGGSLPAFSFPFSQQPLTRYDGGTSKQVGTYNFPVSQGMAGVYMALEPGALRELNWHAFAAEWAFVIEGRTRITLPAPGTWINQQQLIDGQRNDLFKPLVLDPTNACFQSWKRAGHGPVNCP